MNRPARAARGLLTVGLTTLGLHACLVVDTCACTRIAPGATVQGRVLDAAGLGVESARVEAWVRDTDCEAVSALQTVATTDPAGEYALFVTAFGNVDRICLDLLALDPAATPIDSVWARDLMVPISADSLGTIYQSLRFPGPR